MIEAYVANLAWLNVGLAGPEPLKLPADFETAQALLEQLDLADGKHDLVVTEYRADIPGLTKCLSPYDNLDELNYLASLLSELDEEGRGKFAAAVDHGEYGGSVEDLINLAQNLDCYDLHTDIHSNEDLGRLRAEGRFTLPDDCRFYFNYEAYGEDTAINEGGTFTHAGYIYNNLCKFTQHYDGRNVPEEYRLFARPEQERPPSERRDDAVADTKTAAPLLENEHVKELLSILQENNSPGMKDSPDFGPTWPEVQPPAMAAFSIGWGGPPRPLTGFRR